MKQTGELLKNTREQKNLTLHEVGMALKISPRTLQAIEEGDLSKLPQKAFVRGFIKSYAHYMKMDSAAVLDLFTKEQTPVESNAKPVVETSSDIPLSLKTEVPKEIAESIKPIPPTSNSLNSRAINPVEKPHPFLNANSIALFVLGLVFIGSVLLISKLVSKYQRERGSEAAKLELLKTQELTASAEKTPAMPGSSMGDMPGAAASTTAPQIDLAQAAGPSSLMLNATSQLNTKIASSANSKSETAHPTTISKEKEVLPTNSDPTPKEATAASEIKKDESADEKTIPVVKPQEVIIEALTTVGIKFKLGNNKFETIELAPGEMHTFKSKTSINLEINDGGAVNVIANGRDRGVPGKAGKLLRLVYPKQ